MTIYIHYGEYLVIIIMLRMSWAGYTTFVSQEIRRLRVAVQVCDQRCVR